MTTEVIKHKQIRIKVNTECDEDISPIVLALNSIDGVITLDSCQQGVYGESYVFFSYGNNWKDIGYLMNELAQYRRYPRAEPVALYKSSFA